jgi:hypothetical protein
MGVGSAPWQDVDEVLRRFDSRRKKQPVKEYREFVATGWAQGLSRRTRDSST